MTALDASEARATSLADQRRRGFHGHRFEGELESAYRRDQSQDRLRHLRINLAMLADISLAEVQVVMPVTGRIVPDLARTGSTTIATAPRTRAATRGACSRRNTGT